MKISPQEIMSKLEEGDELTKKILHFLSEMENPPGPLAAAYALLKLAALTGLQLDALIGMLSILHTIHAPQVKAALEVMEIIEKARESSHE